MQHVQRKLGVLALGLASIGAGPAITNRPATQKLDGLSGMMAAERRASIPSSAQFEEGLASLETAVSTKLISGLAEMREASAALECEHVSFKEKAGRGEMHRQVIAAVATTAAELFDELAGGLQCDTTSEAFHQQFVERSIDRLMGGYRECKVAPPRPVVEMLVCRAERGGATWDSVREKLSYSSAACALMEDTRLSRLTAGLERSTASEKASSDSLVERVIEGYCRGISKGMSCEQLSESISEGIRDGIDRLMERPSNCDADGNCNDGGGDTGGDTGGSCNPS